MFNISADNDVVTVIDVLSVDPDDQRELLDLLAATTEVLKAQPGFVSASTHRSLDGRRVASYAQWRSEADYRAMLDDPRARERLATVAALARSEPSLYEVVFTTFEPNRSPRRTS